MVIYMDIIISNNTAQPIYEQITNQIKKMVMNGELKAGTPLPSMRSLAKSLHISVITVQRAYDDLQKDGFIESTIGRGSLLQIKIEDLSRRAAKNNRRLHP